MLSQGQNYLLVDSIFYIISNIQSQWNRRREMFGKKVIKGENIWKGLFILGQVRRVVFTNVITKHIYHLLLLNFTLRLNLSPLVCVRRDLKPRGDVVTARGSMKMRWNWENTKHERQQDKENEVMGSSEGQGVRLRWGDRRAGVRKKEDEEEKRCYY